MYKKIGDPKPVAIEVALDVIMSRADAELFALTEAELKAQWYFTVEPARGLAWNLYKFSDMLELYKRRCRRWEEHHYGHSCVVERVRDKYLWPRIEEFAATLREF